MTDINVGQISEALNDKMDRDAHNVQNPSAVVVEKQDPTALNDYTWYRKYSDGWVEQGGTYTIASSSPHTINLSIEMADANYNVLLAVGYGGNGDATVQGHIRTDMLTTTSFGVNKQWSSNSGYYYWQVSGIAAS